MADFGYGAAGTQAAVDEMRQLAKTGSDIQTQEAHRQLYQASADKLNLEAQQSAEWMRLMQNDPGPGGTVESMADHVDRMARAASAAGKIKEAGDLATRAEQIRMRIAVGAKNATQADVNAGKAQRQRLEMLEGVLSGSTDQESWQVNNALYELHTGEQSPYTGMAYSPELTQSLTRSVMQAKDRINTDLRRAEGEERKRHNRETERHSALMRDLARDRLNRLKALDKNKAKAGGKVATGPGQKAVDQMMVSIMKDYPALKKQPLELRGAAYAIAARAQVLTQQNRGLDMETALQQAYKEARDSGDFSTERGVFSSTARFTGGGKLPSTAMELPEDRTTLKAGRYYRMQDGRIVQYRSDGQWDLYREPEDTNEEDEEGEDE